LQIIEKQDIKTVNEYISNINNKLLSLINPLKWLGYKLNCENILLIDEEDTFEIETLAIMLPFRMFINLLEDVWIKNSKLSEILQNQENNWFKQQDLFTKIAKYLYDRNLTLLDLVNKLDINSPTNETN
jgi:hypothetical protein